MFWKPVGFMFFSTIEAFSLYFLIMCLFRYPYKNHAWQALVLTLLVNLPSYILRNEFALGELMPVVTMVFFALFFATVVKMPLAWAFITTISGYVIFGVVQTVVALAMFGSIETAKASVGNGYALQGVSGVLIILAAWLIYRLGYGFPFDMERLRFKFEDIMVIALIVLVLLSVSYIMYFNQVYINLLFFTVTSVYLLYFAVRKEREY